MSDQLPAVAQIQQMNEALAALEVDLIESSHDGSAYAQLIARRASMLREIERLSFAAQLERRQEEERHHRAILDRLAEARAEYRQLRADADQLEHDLAAAADLVEAIIPRCHAIRRALRECAAREDNAIAALKKASPGQPVVEHPTIGAPPIPAEKTAKRWWVIVHEIMAAGGFNSQQASFLQTRRS